MALQDLLNSFNTPPAQQVNVNPANMGMPANPASGTNPTVPADADTSKEAKQDANPLDAFDKMWETPTIKAGEEPKPLYNVDPAKLKEAASTVDFTKDLPPDLLTKIQAGGNEALAAMVVAMNMTAQSTYAKSAETTASLVEDAVKKAQASFVASLPKHLKSQNLSEALVQENPALNHPAAQPIIKAIEKQLAIQYPDATTSELTAHAKTYLEGFAKIANPSKPEPEVKPAKGEVDWGAFLSM